MSPDSPFQTSDGGSSALPPDLLLESALRLSKDLAPTATNLERVGIQTSPEAARNAFAQWELRKRALKKFSRAQSMLFVKEALEQASGEAASRYHASLFPRDEPVVDLTVGIGGDLIQLASRGPVVGFELDAERCRAAQANLQALGLGGEVLHADGMAWLTGQEESFVFADPSRRVEGRRVSLPEQFSPNPLTLAELGRRQRLCVIKLSPLLEDPFLHSLAPRLEFLSIEGECKEVLAICGREAQLGRVAILVSGGLALPETPSGDPVAEPGEYLYECDPAAIRAHSYGALCRQFGLSPLADSHGYLTGTQLVCSPWLKSYRVLYDGRADVKRTRRELTELGSGTPVLKQRLTSLDLERLRATFKMDGKRSLTVVCYPDGKSIRHAIVEPAQ